MPWMLIKGAVRLMTAPALSLMVAWAVRLITGEVVDSDAGVSVTVVIPTVWLMVSLAVVRWLPIGIEIVWSPILMVRLSSPFSSVAVRDALPFGGVKASPIL